MVTKIDAGGVRNPNIEDLPSDDLTRHPRVRISKLSGKTKISNLEFTRWRDQQIVWFQILVEGREGNK